MKLNITVIVLSFIFFSCKKKENNDIEITLLDKEIHVPFFEKDWNDIHYIKNHKVAKVNFKIENKSRSNYIFCPISKDLNKGNSPFNAFPNPLKGLSLNNFIIKDERGKEIKSELGNVLGGLSRCIEQSEENAKFFFENMGENINAYEAILRKNVSSSLILIPSKSILYYESYIGLPVNITDFEMSDVEVIDIKNKKTYSIQAIFSADAKVVQSRLTNDYKKTLKEGDFKIFNGNVYSNIIPLKINKKK